MGKKSLFICLLFLSACGTIINSSEETVTLISGEPKTSIVVRDEWGQTIAKGKNPLNVTLDKGQEAFVRPVYFVSVVSDQNTTKFETKIKPAMSGWFWVNIPFNVGLGMLVDATTGGMWTFRRKDIFLGNERHEKQSCSFCICRIFLYCSRLSLCPVI